MHTSFVVLVVLLVLVTGIGIGRFLHTLRRERGSRLVSCPETHQPTAVRVNAIRAALSSLRGRPMLRLQACSRWPERAGCGQECLGAIHDAPDGCLVRSMLMNWYEGKKCALCGSEVDAAHWYSHEPAFLDAEGRTLEWSEVPVEDLPRALATLRPICWNCHIIESVIREHPDRVVFRP